MIVSGTLLLMGVFAALAIFSSLLRYAVIYLAVFSLLAAFLYVLLGAPELAIAEAVIGSGLVTLLYLIALKRNHVYTIGVVVPEAEGSITDRHVDRVERSVAMREIRAFFVRREFEAQIIFLSVPLAQALNDPTYDLVIAEEAGGLVAYADEDSYVMVELELMFQMHGTDSAIRFEWYAPGAAQ